MFDDDLDLDDKYKMAKISLLRAITFVLYFVILYCVVITALSLLGIIMLPAVL